MKKELIALASAFMILFSMFPMVMVWEVGIGVHVRDYLGRFCP